MIEGIGEIGLKTIEKTRPKCQEKLKVPLSGGGPKRTDYIKKSLKCT